MAKEKHREETFWIALVWLIALALLYMVILKAKLFFNQ